MGEEQRIKIPQVWCLKAMNEAFGWVERAFCEEVVFKKLVKKGQSHAKYQKPSALHESFSEK